MQLLILTTVLASALARPSFIAVPTDQIAFIDLSSLHVRVPRQTLTPPEPQAEYREDYEAIPVQEYADEGQEYQRNERQDYQPNERQQYQPNERQNYQPVPVLPYQVQQYQELLPQHLVPPRAPIQRAPPQVALAPQVVEPTESANVQAAAELSERPADFGEYVDFGAHTGDNGAFGWYADYPINNNHENTFK